MKPKENIIAALRERAHQVTAYAMTLYYFEILFLMLALVFLYGKTAAVAAGVVLSALLAFHIIQIYFRKKRHRVIQLFIIDAHAAFAVACLVGAAVRGTGVEPAEAAILAVRTAILIVELPLLYLLTREDVAAGFA